MNMVTQIREEQAAEAYAEEVESGLSQRHAFFRADNHHLLLTHEDIGKKADELQEARKDAEDQDTDAEEVETIDLTLASRRRRSSLGFVGGCMPAPKAKASTGRGAKAKGANKAKAKARGGRGAGGGGGDRGAPVSSAMSAASGRSGKRPAETPETGLLRASVDTSDRKRAQHAPSLSATSGAGPSAMTLKTIYPSLSIDQVLKSGKKLRRSINGVWPSSCNTFAILPSCPFQVS